MDYSRESSCIFYLRCIGKILTNEQGLAMGWKFITFRPEPKPIEKLQMKLTTKSRFSSVTLELSLIANCSPLLFRHPAFCQTPCSGRRKNLS